MGIVFQHYVIQGLIYVFWITLQGVFLEYESKSYETLVSSIEAHPSKAVQAVLKSFLGKIYKRQKQGFQQKEEGGWSKLRIFLNVTQCLVCPSVPVSQSQEYTGLFQCRVVCFVVILLLVEGLIVQADLKQKKWIFLPPFLIRDSASKSGKTLQSFQF